MLAVDSVPSHSLFKRSGSIWKRFAGREIRAKQSTQNLRMEVKEVHKLQKRHTETIRVQNKNHFIITHLQTVEAPPKQPDAIVPPSTRVTSSDMATTPFPRSRSVQTVGWNIFLTPEQIYSLVMGFAPEQMEDKWFIYSEGPDNAGKLKVHFHRSWTGIKIAELFVLIDLKGEGAGKIVGIKWNGTDQTNHMDEEEAKYMMRTTLAWVLGIDIEKGFS
ncbi:hypothetical protein BDV96DRAFT_568133 [Lophiotrema nucula]|uniref:Uncharacterized protein n=1 Tax=Lophiotrema nucula TaxID=690887 RepID=A0A6A5ZLL2_9PLEO|nr:hypothetical protein BDV96DRAFT_568133 [Lophiotrema nucula]